MVGMNGASAVDAANAAGMFKTGKAAAKDSDYGRTIGEPKLSDKASKYYESLKKKYGNYDFILVSEEEKSNAIANASNYANNVKTVVLIDEDKIEKMATDEEYRKKYEGILSGATAQLEQLKSSVESSGADVAGYGMQVNDDGTSTYFAVLKQASDANKVRLEKLAVKKKAEKQAEAKKAEKKAEAKRTQERMQTKKTSEKSNGSRGKTIDDNVSVSETAADNTNKFNNSDTITISANSVEDLVKKLQDYSFISRSDSIQTESEKMVGQHVDFRG